MRNRLLIIIVTTKIKNNLMVNVLNSLINYAVYV